MQGKQINPEENPGFKYFADIVARKKANGVDIINMQVLDLPISDALRFGIGFLRASEKSGQRSLFIERRSVADLVKWFQDFYMFDSKIVMNIIYDEKVEGKYLGAEELITDPKEVSRYVNLRNKMVKAAVPMEDFLKQHNIPLDNIF